MSFSHIAKKGRGQRKKRGVKKGGPPFFSWRIDLAIRHFGIWAKFLAFVHLGIFVFGHLGIDENKKMEDWKGKEWYRMT